MQTLLPTAYSRAPANFHGGNPVPQGARQSLPVAQPAANAQVGAPQAQQAAISRWQNVSPRTQPFTTQGNAGGVSLGAIPNWQQTTGVLPGSQRVIQPAKANAAKTFGQLIQTIVINH